MTPLQIHDAKAVEKKAAEAAHFLEALANPRRLMILCALAEGERSVGELIPIVGLQQAALSQHLARLRVQGLVSTRRSAQTIYYRLVSPAAAAIIKTLAEVFCPVERPVEGEGT